MVSAWWLVAAFFGGGTAAVLLMALMYMAGQSAQSPRVPDLHSAAWDLQSINW
jgi:hypothetical protein